MHDEDRPLRLCMRTLAYLRTVRDGSGKFIWQPGLHSELNTIMGMPYEVISPDYPIDRDFTGPETGPILDALDEGFIDQLRIELARARAKFPDPYGMLAAMTEEVGEVAKAMLEEEPERVRAEAIQVAVTAIRIAVEGDRSLNPFREKAGLELIV